MNNDKLLLMCLAPLPVVSGSTLVAKCDVNNISWGSSSEVHFLTSEFGIEQFSIKSKIEQKANRVTSLFKMELLQQETFNKFLEAFIVEYANTFNDEFLEDLKFELYEEDSIRIFSSHKHKNINIIIYEEGDIFVSQIFKNKPSVPSYFDKNKIDYLDLVSKF